MADFSVGSLVRARGREWVVLPESTAEETSCLATGGRIRVTGATVRRQLKRGAEHGKSGLLLPGERTDHGKSVLLLPGERTDHGRRGFLAPKQRPELGRYELRRCPVGLPVATINGSTVRPRRGRWSRKTTSTTSPSTAQRQASADSATPARPRRPDREGRRQGHEESW